MRMKCTRILLLIFLIVIAPRVVSAQRAEKGDVARIPKWTWIDVKNPEPIKSGNVLFGYGGSCGISAGGTLMVVGIEGTGYSDRLLVRYSSGDTHYGTHCPNGVIFFVTKRAFSKMTAEYRRIRATERAEKDLVKRLIKK